ncbi:MAG: rod shape-determining protein RodA [Gammaproteobacteria bacterium]|nr:MAG: rod shape-determining protein RodA [Gammaproteobacteria bacterium]
MRQRQLSALGRIHIDGPLLTVVLLLCGLGLLVLYSASGQDTGTVIRQAVRMGMGLAVMIAVAQVPPHRMADWAPWLYLAGLVMLLAVLLIGHTGKGAQRWLDLGLFRFQPSELMKLAVPMVVAWYYHDRPLPPNGRRVAIAGVVILVPCLLIAKQPDLGTALLIGAAGFFVMFLAGLSWRFIGLLGLAGLGSLPLLWYLMRDYQRQRVLTLLDPQRDPLGSGYHIIQSQIAVGSGGLYGKGWLNGTQSHLEFLPEGSTDFIFAVFSEEFGLLGVLLLLSLYAFVILRGLYIASAAQGTFGRLLAGSLSLTLFIYIFVNIGMVIGQLPVVGVPLPLISYGGTSLVTMMAGFGILMSIHTHRRLVSM